MLIERPHRADEQWVRRGVAIDQRVEAGAAHDLTVAPAAFAVTPRPNCLKLSGFAVGALQVVEERAIDRAELLGQGVSHRIRAVAQEPDHGLFEGAERAIV